MVRLLPLNRVTVIHRNTFDYAWGTLYPQIMGNQSADGIDTASGATSSSEGILGAVQKALAQALA